MLKLTQLSGFGGAPPPTDFDLTIDAKSAEIDLRSYLAARGYRSETNVTVAIAAGVQVYSSTTAEPGLRVDLADFPGNARIALTVHGEICGRGGASGAAGGTALEVVAGRGATLAVDNRGEINGGGGGGARGNSDSCTERSSSGKETGCTGSTTYCSGGSGGTGYGPNPATRGSSGQSKRCSGCGRCNGGSGSSGGGKGLRGIGGGGAAGAAVAGNDNIEWTHEGVRNGTVS